MSRTILPVWLTTAAAAIIVGVTAGDAFLTWLPVVLAGVLLLTFAIQLILSRKEELVTRMIFSIGGALVILIVATVVVLFCFLAVVGRLSVQIGISALIPAMISGGILAHVSDRALFGHVRDFIHTGWLIIDFADVAIVAGIVWLAVAFTLRLRALRRSSQTIVFEFPVLRAVIVDNQRAAA